MNYRILRNGVEIPMLGYGTLQITADIAQECVTNALQVGYRLIDTASAYFNEKEVGLAIKKSCIPREELCICTKVWIQDSGYEKTKIAFHTSLKNLDVTYIDLYLIHQPYGDYYGSWRAMEEFYKEGKIKAIGVCNFSMERFTDLYMNCTIKPMINQIEVHPFHQQSKLYSLYQEYDCQMQAWGPLNEGQKDIFNNKILKEISQKHRSSVTQVILRWHIQRGIVAIPKTIYKDRMIENMCIWDFILDNEDMQKIASLDIGYSEIIDYQSYRTAKKLNTCKIHK